MAANDLRIEMHPHFWDSVARGVVRAGDASLCSVADVANILGCDLIIDGDSGAAVVTPRAARDAFIAKGKQRRRQ